MEKKIEIRKSNIHGKGVVANIDIEKGKTIIILKGKIVYWEIKDQKSSLYGPNWIGLSKKRWLDVKTPGINLNHSCNPNCGIRGRLKVVTLRDIKKGEEITIDYSITEMDKLWFMKCKCGQKNCRKTIRSIQFLPKKTYLKYKPSIPTYFMKVYNKVHNV